MAGNREGGLKTAQTNRDKHGDDFYQRIGSMGGKTGKKRGGFNVPGVASRAGRIGGLRSRRVVTDEDKQRQSELMKKLWAQRRAAEWGREHQED